MPKSTYAATITLDNPTPKYGDTIIAAVTTDAPKSGCRATYFQNGVQVAQSDIVYKDGPTYTEDFGLYAPSWPSGAAEARFEVVAQITGKGKRASYETIATLIVQVAA